MVGQLRDVYVDTAVGAFDGWKKTKGISSHGCPFSVEREARRWQFLKSDTVQKVGVPTSSALRKGSVWEWVTSVGEDGGGRAESGS